MQIPINKKVIVGALPALGKLVSRTSLIKAYQGIEIEGKANMLYFRTRNVTEEIEFRLFADLEDDFPPVLVEFDQFRQVVRNCKKKDMEIEVDCGEIYIDDVKLASVKGRFPVPEVIPDQDVTVTELPADTLSALTAVAPMAEKGADYRKILSGINLSRDGFTATNNKELSNIPAELNMGSVTIPFPLALLATKAFGESGRFSTWQKDEDTHFELTLGAWTWRAKAFKENYPNWKRVVPERTDATHYVRFNQDVAEQLQRYLKCIPDDPRQTTSVKLSRLPDVLDHLNLASSNGMLISVLAEFDANWGDLSFVVSKELFGHLLNGGHTRIEINDAFGPFVGTGGTGRYIAMPIRVKSAQAQTTPPAEQTASNQPDATSAIQPEQTAPQPVPESTKSVPEQMPPYPQETKPQNIITNTTTSNKETQTMNENTTITHTVSAPVQTYTNHEPEKEMNPLDELLASIEAFKVKIKDMFDESAAMSRKVREVAIAQKQKEREYNQTKRALERVRVVTGAA